MGVDLPPVPGSSLNETDKALAILCHLSIFLGVPFLLPLVVFLVKREAGGWVGEQAKESLNFHLTLLIYAVFCFLPLIFCLIGIAFLGALWLFGAICGVIAAIRAAEGGFYRYPITIRLF